MAKRAPAPGSKLAAQRAQREAEYERRQAGGVDPEAAYAERVVGLLRKTASDIIELGSALLEAKQALPHGRFTGWVEERLPISVRTAQRFMVISGGLPKSADPRILPPSAETLHDLARLSSAEWKTVQPHVSPDMTQRDLRQLLHTERAPVEAPPAAGAPPTVQAAEAEPLEATAEPEPEPAATSCPTCGRPYPGASVAGEGAVV